MIMYSIHPTQNLAPVVVDAGEAMDCMQSMLRDGVSVQTNTFQAPDGASVSVFYSRDGQGRVATVWEHTYQTLGFNVPPQGLGEHSVVLQTADMVTLGANDNPDGYSVGE